MSDLDLLRLEMDLLWGPDLYGRDPTPHPQVALALAADGHALRFGADMPSGVRASLEKALSHDPSSDGLRRECERLLGLGWCKGGPSYVFGGEEPSLSDVRILTSGDPAQNWLEGARPDAWGDPEEWRNLLAGRLGPWAFGVAEGRVASVCYTPVASTRATEAGIWTAPETRGRGYGTAAVAAWGRVAAGRFETLFYSTGSDNAASQAVARKLGLRPIGTIWQVR